MADGDAPTGPAYTELIPRPDPSRLTDAAIEPGHRRVPPRDHRAPRDCIEARLDGMDQDRARLWDRTEDIIRRFTAALDDFRAEVERRDVANRQLIEQRLDRPRQSPETRRQAHRRHTRPGSATSADRVCRDFHAELRAEREYIMGQITNALAETRRTGDVAQEKFAAVDALFASNALALAAALAAQEKAVAAQNDSNTLAISKSESSTKETISANAAQAQTGLSSLSDQVTDLKDRLVRIESVGVGVAATRTDQRASVGTIIAAVATLAAVVSFILLVIRK